MGVVEIPDNLLDQASRVPGLRERVARFIQLEVTQYEIRQKRFRPETLALLARAQLNAGEISATGFDPDVERAELLRGLAKMTTDDLPCP